MPSRRAHLLEFARKVGVEFDMEQRDILHIYKKQSEFDHARRVNTLLEQAGLERREASADEVQRLEPTLQSKTIGGFYTQSDFTGDIHRYARKLSGCETFFPTVSTEHCVPWAGLRPMLPSMMPRVGPGAKPGVYYNTGHGHLGLDAVCRHSTGHGGLCRCDADKKCGVSRVRRSLLRPATGSD